MPQAVPLALVAPTRPGLTNVGYLVRGVAGLDAGVILTNWTEVAESGANTGYYQVTGTVNVPDAGAIVEFRQVGNTGTFLSAVTVDPVPANFSSLAITASTGQVTVGTLANNVITANSINSGAITNAKFAAGAIDATAIATDAITAAKIANNAITADKIADNAIDAAAIASNAITAAKIATDAITAAKIADNAIDAGSIASGAITNAKFAAGAIDATAIADNAITAAKIATDAFDADAIAASAVTEIQSGLATQASVDTKASQASVDTIPKTPLLAANYTAPDNAGIAAIKAKTDNLPADPADQSALADLINTRLAAADYIAPNNTPVLAAIELLPTEAEIATAVEAALIAEGDGQKLLEAIQGAVQDLFNTGTDVPITTLVGAIADRITADHGTGAYTTANLSAVALQTTLEAVQAKTNALPADPADQSELAQLIAAIPQGLTTQQNTRLTQLWQQAGFDSAVPVVRDKEGDVITETIGTTVITHTATNDGDTVTTERQP